jgi:hypothetical protein
MPADDLVLNEKTEKQIAHRLKSVRDDKTKKLVTAHPSASSGQALKVRPFNEADHRRLWTTPAGTL